MKLKSLVIGGVMVLCAGLAIFALTKWHRDFGGGDDDQPQEKAEPVITVQTGALKHMTLHQYVNGYGTIEAAAGSPLASPSAGVVAKVNAIDGQEVKAGDVLVELNSGTATYQFAKAQVDRQKKLLADQNTSLKNVQDAESQLAALQIVSPISGTVIRIPAKVGAAVDANAVVAEVVDLNQLLVSAQIPAAEAGDLKTGQEVRIGESVLTSVSFVSSAVDAADGTVLTRALLPSNSGLRPGEFVTLKIITAIHTNCLVAPAASVVTDEEGKRFVALVKGEEAAQTPVTIGLGENGWTEIKGADLKEGDLVVTVGAYGFPDKAKIRVANAAAGESTSSNSVPAQ